MESFYYDYHDNYRVIKSSVFVSPQLLTSKV